MSSTQALRSIFKGDIVTSDDPGYEDAISRWTTNAVRKAQMVVFVKDAEDASLAVKFALAANLKIAIRGGGHSPSGASSRDGGLVIDLSKYLNGVRVDPDKKLAYVGGGALWATVDKAAIQHGLATVGGTVNHVGILFPPKMSKSHFGVLFRPVSAGEYNCLAHLSHKAN